MKPVFPHEAENDNKQMKKSVVEVCGNKCDSSSLERMLEKKLLTMVIDELKSSNEKREHETALMAEENLFVDFEKSKIGFSCALFTQEDLIEEIENYRVLNEKNCLKRTENWFSLINSKFDKSSRSKEELRQEKENEDKEQVKNNFFQVKLIDSSSNLELFYVEKKSSA
ncbi:hypothetical protein ACFE04_008633 [Oxalis oulophora]